ncbi:MAG: chromate transporter [Oscillospiraceae bacterium]|nr:chromate transporter [Oscillospiraceae bacterium]
MIYLTLFLEFFKVGLFCFGGAFGMIPLIEEIVMHYGWLSESEFFDLIGVCESTPGPIAVNMATYIGSVQGGIFGSIAATLGVVMPSFLIILLVASVMKNLTENRVFRGFMQGVKPVIVALILSTGVILLVKAVGAADLAVSSQDIVPMLIFALLAALYFGYGRITGKKLSSVLLILISAGLGVAVSLLGELAVQ